MRRPQIRRDDIILVFDSGPLLAIAAGLPFKTLSVTSYIQNDYSRTKDMVYRLKRKSLVDIADALRRDFLRHLERKEEAAERVLHLLDYCIRHPGNCVVPREVLDELDKYSFQPEIRDFLRLIDSETTRTTLVAEFNEHMRRIGRGEKSPHPQTILPAFFEKLAGHAFSWDHPSLKHLRETDPNYEKWFNIIDSYSRFYRKGLSETDEAILAYVAYLNWKGIPAIAVIGDNKMKQVADRYGIPIYYMYYGFRNGQNLGKLELKPNNLKLNTEEKEKEEEEEEDKDKQGQKA